MKTKLVSITDLSPGDKVYVEWPSDRERPVWHTLPDVLTVKKVELPDIVLIEETGGICLKTKEFHRVLEDPNTAPEIPIPQLTLF